MRTNPEWKYWGRHDPLWAVASKEGREVGGPNPWTPEEFLALGASDFEDVLRHWTHYGVHPGRCVEIGSGAGRMTKPLAQVFDSVLALDISADQILRARELLGSGSRNVDFRVLEQPVIPTAEASCDAMFSCHVFQHLPGKEAVATYLRETHRVLRPDRSVCFHVPVPGAHISSRQSALGYAARNFYTRIKRALGILDIAEYHWYPVRDIFLMLMDLGFKDPELRIVAMSSNGDYHSYFFARKA